MQPLNAIDAIAPAFKRTHEILFKPFRWGRSWKLAVSQYLGLVGAAFMPFPLLLAFFPMNGMMPGMARAAILVGSVIVTLLLFAFFYVGVRMQFVDFEMIVTRAEFIAPMWRRYGLRVWPVIGLKTVIGTALPLVMFPLLRNSMTNLFHTLSSLPLARPGVGASVDAAVIRTTVAHVLSFYALLVCAFLVLKIVSSSFEDFAMPFFILEEISLLESIARGWRLIARDPLQCVLYLVLKLGLTLLGGIVWYIALVVTVIALAIVALVVVAIGAGISALTHGGDMVHLLLLAAGILTGLMAYAAMVWYQLGSLGYGTMLLEAYGVYFLGGRYAHLGSMLEPGPGGPFTPPPVFPSAEEREDDEGGPPMPMDPAVA